MAGTSVGDIIKVEGCCRSNMGSWGQHRRQKQTKGNRESGATRNAKRARIGNPADRALYKSAKPHKDAGRYSVLCRRADGLNGRRS